LVALLLLLVGCLAAAVLSQSIMLLICMNLSCRFGHILVTLRLFASFFATKEILPCEVAPSRLA
jgi:hypothetical protein